MTCLHADGQRPHPWQGGSAHLLFHLRYATLYGGPRLPAKTVSMYCRCSCKSLDTCCTRCTSTAVSNAIAGPRSRTQARKNSSASMEPDSSRSMRSKRLWASDGSTLIPLKNSYISGVSTFFKNCSKVISPFTPPSKDMKISRALLTRKWSLSVLALKSTLSTKTPVTTFIMASMQNAIYIAKTKASTGDNSVINGSTIVSQSTPPVTASNKDNMDLPSEP
mmetsp:Transcript_78692/g.220559  ORF Transcript_78692/g.220559 Transcript_78692/m.220559 type:complete len:221 (+) Transcript_78692:160-822(+)